MEQDILKELEQIKRYALLGGKDTFDVDEAALYMKLSKNTIYTLVSKREIASYLSKGEKKKYFKREDLDRCMLHNRIASREEIEQAAASHCWGKKI